MSANENSVSLQASEDAIIYDFPAGNILISEETDRDTTAEEITSLTLRDRFRATCIRTHLVIDGAFRELDDGLQEAENWHEKADLAATTTLAIGGQVYERARLPEVFAYSGTAWAYREAIASGMNSALATLAISAAVGGFVYGQQKIIGRNFVNTAVHYPETYDTINQMWPKTMALVGDAIPSKENPVGEGLGMVALGTTPFIASARVSNPDITVSELREVERRVTRRGAIASSGIAGTALGVLSLAPHLPEKVAEGTVKWTDIIIDKISSPVNLILTFGGWAVLKAGGRALRNRRKPKEA